MLFLLEHALRTAGYYVESATSYDLVLADGVLGDGTGIAVADKASKSGAKTLIITGFTSMFRRDELLRHL